MKNIKLILIAIILGLPTYLGAQNYSKLFQDAVKKAIGSDLAQFKTFSYPVDNFGVLTMYNKKVSPTEMLCDMLYCIEGVEGDKEDWIGMKGFVAIGNGGPIMLEQTVKNNWGADVILPKLYQVLGISASANSEKEIGINVEIEGAVMRTLRRQPVMNYINSLDKSTEIFKAYNNGRLVIIVADCIIKGVTVKINKTAALKTKLDAKVGGTDNEVVSKIFNDAQLTVKIDRDVDGEYTIKFEQPLIFATLSKKQPKAGELGDDDNFDNWLDAINLDRSADK